ncbi:MULTISPECIES: YybH family protein [unclassified Gordonia (in: high G+C Gram-positive bacteria)]
MRLTPEERLDIAALVVAADDCASDRDDRGYLALFDVDASFAGAKGDVTGRDAIRALIDEVWGSEPEGTLHLTTSVAVSPELESGAAVAVSGLLLVRPDTNAVIAAQRITHRLERAPDGGWLFTERRIR